MILNNAVRNDVYKEQVDDKDHYEMTVSASATGHIIRMLTRAYSDKVGSLIREALANSVDSMRMANKTEPVICRIKRDVSGNWLFEAEDEGLGLSKEDFHKYIMGVGESNKQGLSNVIGGYGIGAKAATSYTDSYYYTCRKDGIERKFIIYAGEVKPESDLMYEVPTDKFNGVTVTVPIKPGEYYDFIDKCKEQLAYFDGVYFDIPGFNNDFKIYRGQDFQWSELCKDDSMHISMDNVYYPIDWKKLGIPQINLSIALKFSLTDGLIPIPNREQLEYTNVTKKIILEKIGVIANWMVEKWNQDNLDRDSVLDVWESLNTNNKYVHIRDVEGNILRTFEISGIIKYSKLKLNNISVKGITHLSLEKVRLMSEDILRGWRYCGVIKDNKKWKGDYDHGGISDQSYLLQRIILGSDKIFLLQEKMNNVLKDYIKDVIGKSFFITESNYKFTLEYYKKILGLNRIDKKLWREHIKEFQLIQQQFINKVTDISTISPSKVWLEDRKNRITRRTAIRATLGEIHPKYAEVSDRGDNWATFKSWGKKEIKDVKKEKCLTIYSLEEDKHTLSELFRLIRNTNVCILGKKDYEKMEQVDFKNWVLLSDFLKNRGINMYKEFSRCCTSHKIESVLQKYPLITKNISYLKELNSNFTEDLEKLVAYKKSYTSWNTNLMLEMLQICEENKLWDLEMLAILDRVEKWIVIFDFIKYLRIENDYRKNINVETLPLAKDIMRMRKIRMNLSNYNLLEEMKPEIVVGNVEEVDENLIAEEIIEEEELELV